MLLIGRRESGGAEFDRFRLQSDAYTPAGCGTDGSGRRDATAR
jgi:hypothetical protein